MLVRGEALDGVQIGKFRLPQAQSAGKNRNNSNNSNNGNRHYTKKNGNSLIIVVSGMLLQSPSPVEQVAVIVIFIVSGLCLDSISECLQYKARLVQPRRQVGLQNLPRVYFAIPSV